MSSIRDLIEIGSRRIIAHGAGQLQTAPELITEGGKTCAATELLVECLRGSGDDAARGGAEKAHWSFSPGAGTTVGYFCMTAVAVGLGCTANAFRQLCEG